MKVQCNVKVKTRVNVLLKLCAKLCVMFVSDSTFCENYGTETIKIGLGANGKQIQCMKKKRLIPETTQQNRGEKNCISLFGLEQQTTFFFLDP